MKLSKRLKHIANLVDHKSIVADIGCDHGLLPIYLIEQKICSKAYACDLREGPLARAEQAIRDSGNNETISTILTDGLEDVPNDVDTVIIAGMGFETIRKILENNFKKVTSYKHIILQSNTDVAMLRKWLSEKHFLILIDDVVKDGHFYHILKCEPKNGKGLEEDEILFGIAQNSSDFLSFCEYELKKIKKIISSLSSTHKHYNEFMNYKKLLLKKIELMKK